MWIVCGPPRMDWRGRDWAGKDGTGGGVLQGDGGGYGV